MKNWPKVYITQNISCLNIIACFYWNSLHSFSLAFDIQLEAQSTPDYEIDRFDAYVTVSGDGVVHEGSHDTNLMRLKTY